MSETDSTNCEAVGEQADADWYHEWHVSEDGTVLSRGWTPLMGVDHDGLSAWRQNCLDAIMASIDPEDYEGEIVARSWAYYDEGGVSFDALVDGIEDPEVPEQ